MTAAPATSESGVGSIFLADVDLAEVHPHPRNPRHTASADPEMVASVKEHGLLEPLLLAPRDEGGWWLVAGHRRRDALKKARRKTAPALVRNDLADEAAAVVAMLIENGHRRDLSPLEEAEGFEQLTLFGWTQKAIAAETGHAASTVRDRLKLLKLGKPAKDKVHDGQISLEDAVTLAQYADDKAATKKLEAAAGTPNFRHTVEKIKTDRKTKAAREKASRTMAAAGVDEYKLPKGKFYWNLGYPDLPDRANSTGAEKVAEDNLDHAKKVHDGCLAWFDHSSPYAGFSALLLCTDPGKHADELYAQRQAEAVEREREREAWAKAAEEKSAAAKVRVADVVTYAQAVKLPAGLVEVLRGVGPAAVEKLGSDGLALYYEHVGVPEDKRWGRNQYPNNARHQENLAAHRKWLVEKATARDLLAGVLVELLSYLEQRAGVNQDARHKLRAYTDLLETIGHAFSDPDQELLAEIADLEAAAAGGEE